MTVWGYRVIYGFVYMFMYVGIYVCMGIYILLGGCIICCSGLSNRLGCCSVAAVCVGTNLKK